MQRLQTQTLRLVGSPLAECEIVCIDPSRVHEVWPHVAHFIKAAMVRSDLGLFDDIERDVLRGAALLWLAWCDPNIEGAGVTQISRTEKSKVCTIYAWAASSGRDRWFKLLEQIESYARGIGCDCVRIFGRPGWRRLLKNYKATKIILERRL